MLHITDDHFIQISDVLKTCTSWWCENQLHYVAY